MKKSETSKMAFKCLMIAVLLVLLCSCFSFDIGDWPSRFVYPHNEPSANLCGAVGGFCAYYLMYYIGPGAFVILISGICFLVAKLAHLKISQPLLRTLGLALLMVAVSSSFYCLWPSWKYSFPIGSGGLIGTGATHFLKSHFASFGTFILITATWIVGIVLLADSFVLAVLRGFGFAVRKTAGVVAPAWLAAKQQSETLAEIWQKLHARQKPAPPTSNVPYPAVDIDTKDRVEIEGIKRSKKRLEDADLVIFMLDASSALTDRDKDIYNAIKDKKNIVVANKADLARKLALSEAAECLERDEVLEVSALKKTGLESLEDAIGETLLSGEVGTPEGTVITNLRHKECLEKAESALSRAIQDAQGKHYELIASDVNGAIHSLGLIIGESIEDDILDRIFSQFCIGK